MKKFLISLLTVFMMASLAACGNTGDAESVSSAKVLTKKLANESDKKIEISEDIVLTEPKRNHYCSGKRYGRIVHN